ncbi:MgtC/SapB family protein [Rhodoferax sp.]|uniref:MgtC/SapB family protein n=1 Tax=Rhodoferax sp. TaxID=50421 RepID=UPI002753BC92|nr:MgtC/SapB family protein [Rhodoferax sp.]
MITLDTLSAFWTGPVVSVNILVFFNLIGALALGLMVGYERSYHGRAAGMRTYGLVCMSSAALTVISGYSQYWFGGSTHMATIGDLTRVIQGIVTGIGFLCAGVIMKEGFSISGLTTAASLWASSAIGILVGVGFYAAAMLLAVLCTVCMVWMSKLEAWLPSRQAVAMTLRFNAGYQPVEAALRDMASARGYDIAGGTITVALDQGEQEWRFIAVARSRQKMVLISELAAEMAKFNGVKSFHLAYARN